MKPTNTMLLLIVGVGIATFCYVLFFGYGQDALSSSNKAYARLRNKVLHVTPEALNLQQTDTQQKVYGVMADIMLEKGALTYVAFATGDASIYTQNGGMILGGYKLDSVQTNAMQLVFKSNELLPNATASIDTNLPALGHYHLYLLTKQRNYQLTGHIKKDINTQKGHFLKLIMQAIAHFEQEAAHAKALQQ